jgi:methyl acetate hydrolase
MNKFYFFLTIFCTQVLVAQKFPSQEDIKQAMDLHMQNSDLPALVATAINKKNESRTYTFGKAVWTENTPVNDKHIFRIASMTKLVTSIAAMQLVEKKLIGLDDDLSTLLPEMTSIPILTKGELTSPKNKISLRHLLTHTAGFGYRGATDKELTDFDTKGWTHKDNPRRFESGTDFLYGSSTYWAGKVVEKVSKMDLEAYYRKHITGPLGMNSTWFNLPDSLKKYVVSSGRRGADGKQSLTENPTRIPTNVVTDYRGDGGLFSSPEDYDKLLKCLLNYGKMGKVNLLKKASIKEMNKNQIGGIVMKKENAFYNPGGCCNFEGLFTDKTKWGLAWMIDTEDKPYGRKAGTVTWGGAFNTFFYIDYKSGIAASIYTQHAPFNHEATTSLFDKFSELIYKPSKK